MRANLAVVILTYNEEIHLARALHHIEGLASEVFVVDSYSTDRTVQIAKEFGAMVLQHPFTNYAKQYEWALENAPITTEWVMRLDADEIIEPDLVIEIQEKLPTLPKEVCGINLKRKTIFQGREIRHGGRYPLILLRIWRRGKAKIEDRWMDEHNYLLEGEQVTFDGGFADYSLQDLTFFTSKHNGYSSREALQVYLQRRGMAAEELRGAAKAATRQASRKRLMKEVLYERIPFEIAAASYFLLRYVFQLGFLDGRAGLQYHFLQGFWYRFLVGSKLRELKCALKGIEDKKKQIEILERLTRQRINLD